MIGIGKCIGGDGGYVGLVGKAVESWVLGYGSLCAVGQGNRHRSPTTGASTGGVTCTSMPKPHRASLPPGNVWS